MHTCTYLSFWPTRAILAPTRVLFLLSVTPVQSPYLIQDLHLMGFVYEDALPSCYISQGS